MLTEEQKMRKETIIKLLRMEKEFRVDLLVAQYEADKDTVKYARSFNSIEKNYRHIATNIKDYFDMS